MKKTVLLHRGRKNEENFQIVSVNGRSWKIMKGVEVQVPDSMVESQLTGLLQELESRGLLQAQRTAGRTVTADDTALQALRRRRAGTLAAEFLHQMQALGLTEAEIETLLRETAQQAQKKE